MNIKIKILFIIFLCIFFDSSGTIDLENFLSDFIIETKRIIIPECPYIFNPSIVRWQNKFLMSFRIRQNNTTNKIGLIYLDNNLNPIGNPYIIKTPKINASYFCMGLKDHMEEQDPRLICIKNKLYMIYSHYKVGKMIVATIKFENNKFICNNPKILLNFDKAKIKQREKNWVPFVYHDNLLLARTIFPHQIIKFKFRKNYFNTFSFSNKKYNWQWGIIRGGTPALKIDNFYLSFFHSSKKIATKQSQNKKNYHYFMGAYLFSTEPPFDITHISPNPIIANNFYEQPPYDLYRPLRVIYPAGFIYDENYIWVFYGKHDNEAWYVKLDKNELLKSLVSLTK